MTTARLFELFVLNNTKGRDGVNKNAKFREVYGDVSFEEAFEVYLAEINIYISLRAKIAAFEKFLIKNNVQSVYSNISESRYYYYEGVKYRFSAHVYPTGSMTSELMGVVDLAADPELIEKVKYD